MARSLTVVQVVPALDSGGVEKGTLELGRYLVQQGHHSIVISAGGRLRAELVRQGSEHIEWDIGAKRLSTLRLIWPLRQWLRTRRPDILHVRSRLPAWITYWAWKGLPVESRPHFVSTVHGFYRVGSYSSVMTRGERVITVSQAVRDYVRTHYSSVDAAHMEIIHRGVDRSVYPYGYRPDAAWLDDWHARYPHLQRCYVVTLPARLTRWKGQEHMLAVIGGLRKRGVPAHGLLVGAAHPRKRGYERRLRAKIAAAGLDSHITLLGHRTDMREIMAVSDAVVSLSLDPEAFGRTTLEALSLGIPVAAYDHGGVAEQLAACFPQGRVPVGDKRAVRDLLLSWYRHPPVVAAEHPFTLDRMLRATLDLYHALTA